MYVQYLPVTIISRYKGLPFSLQIVELVDPPGKLSSTYRLPSTDVCVYSHIERGQESTQQRHGGYGHSVYRVCAFNILTCKWGQQLC